MFRQLIALILLLAIPTLALGYDLIYSWLLGAEINNSWYGAPERSERFAPWNKAKVAIFYPEPFGRTTHWPEHFVAYVRGAHSIKSVPELEPSESTQESNSP